MVTLQGDIFPGHCFDEVDGGNEGVDHNYSKNIYFMTGKLFSKRLYCILNTIGLKKKERD